MNKATLSLFSLFFLFPGGSNLQAAPHGLTVNDMVAFDRVSDPKVSPDGKRVVFSISRLEMENNRRRTDLYAVNVDGQELRRLTTDPGSEFNPVFAPDGKSLYFLSGRSGSSAIWRLSFAGGESEKVSDLDTDIEAFVLSRDGKTFVVALKTFPECDTLSCSSDKLKALEANKASGVVYDELLYRHWDTFSDLRRTHLFALTPGTEPIDLMKGMKADAPSIPFGDMTEVAFTPDGKGLVFTAKDAGREEAWSTDFDLYLVPLDGSKAPTCLTDDNKAWDTAPAFSPDGKTLAYLAMSRAGYEADRFRVMIRSWPDGTARPLADAWDRSAQNLLWDSTGKTLYTTADHLGQVGLFALEVPSGKVTELLAQGSVGAPVQAGRSLVFGLDTLSSPVELMSLELKTKAVKPLTSINSERLKDIAFGAYEQFSFKGYNDETVYGYVVKPSSFDSTKKYPVAFLIHGGPQGSFGNHFHYRWNPQAYTGHGFAAVMIDFHGSTGYGQAFTDAIRGDWGGKPLVDLQKGLEAAIAKYPWLDGDRVAALGASYGGYMINWIAGQWPDRFRCLVVHDGNLDERFAYYDTEELWFPEWDHQGTPWDNPEGYTKHNPIEYVKNWKTPTLVVHGAKDYRVVESHGMATFTALQRRGIPSRFLYFPDENHWVLKPANSILWHETVLDWLDQWLLKP